MKDLVKRLSSFIYVVVWLIVSYYGIKYTFVAGVVFFDGIWEILIPLLIALLYVSPVVKAVKEMLG